MNFCFGIFLVGGLLGTGLTGFAEDPLCLVDVLSEVKPTRFFTNPDFVCQDIKQTFKRAESNIRKCTNQHVDISELKSLHDDFCDADSHFSREFSKNRACFLDKLAESSACYDPWLNDSGSNVKESCRKLVAETIECLNKDVKEICGDSSLEVYKRMNEAEVPLLTALCIEMNGAAVLSFVTWIILGAAITAIAWQQY